MFLEPTANFLTLIVLMHILFIGNASDVCFNVNLGIIRGHAIPIEDARHMAALILEGTYADGLYCGASIVHKQFLLTSAYCERDPKYTVASTGSELYKQKTTKIKIDQFLCHEKFDHVIGRNDICLVKLKKPLRFSKKIGNIDLPNKNFIVKSGTMVNVTGWGLLLLNDTAPPPTLHQTTIPVVSHKCCHDADHTVDDSMMCAGAKSRGPCLYDAGGPLSYHNVLVGVVSHLPTNHTGALCGGGVDIYTRVSSFVDWIHTTITKHL